MLFFIIFLLSYFPLYYSGLISKWDYSSDFTNTGYLKKLTLGFSLENGLSASDYIKLIFPFNLHTTSLLQVPIGLSVTLNKIGSIGCLSIQTSKTNIFTGAGETGAYYIQLLDEKEKINKPLEKNEWFSLEFSLSNPVSNPAGIYEPIKIYTVSSRTNDAIIYDYNNVFGNIEITKAPSQNTLKAEFFMNSPNKNDVNFIHNVIFDITPSKKIIGAGRIMILMKNNDWKFNGKTCISIMKNTTDVKADALDSSLFECQIDTINNMVIISFKTTIEIRLYSFQISIRNPNHVITGGSFQVRTLQKYANHIIELIDTPSSFSVNPFTWGTNNNKLSIFLGWGVDLKQANLPDNFVVIRGENSATPYKFYNSLKFIFSPSYETVPGVKLKIVLQLNELSGFEILTGSLSENLPPFSSDPVQCIYDKAIAIENKIVCNNVGVLSNISNYHIAFKAYFAYSVSNKLDDEFGKISVYTYNTLLKTYDTNLLILPGRNPSVSYKTRNNINLFGPTPVASLNIEQHFLVHSLDVSSVIPPITSSNFGLKAKSAEEQDLIFTLTIDSNSITGGNAFLTGAGFTFYMSNSIEDRSIFNPLDPDKEGNNILVRNTLDDDFMEARIGNDKSEGRQWTWTKIYNMLLTDLINDLADDGIVTKKIAISRVLIRTVSSNYVEINNFDFYGTSAYNIRAVSPSLPTIVSYFGINAFVISETNLGDGLFPNLIRVGLVNFWTGDTGFGEVDGTKFPVFIRLIGYLDPSLIPGVKRLAVFFDNLEYFSTSKYNGNIDLVDCSSSLSSKTTCYGYKGQSTYYSNIHSLNRIEIDVDILITGTSQASPFQILIPVKSINKLNSVHIFFSTMITNSVYGVYKQYFSIKNTFSNYFITPTYASLPSASIMSVNPSLTSLKYYLSFLSSPTPKVGAIGNPAIVLAGHTDADPSLPQINPNDNTGIGAGFTYISEYNMIGNGFYSKANWINSGLTSTQCLPFSYSYDITNKYGFFCPFSSGSIASSTSLQVFNFQYPYQDGVNLIANTYGAWSNNNGLMKGFFLHNNGDMFTQGFIEIIGNGVISKLEKNTLNQQLIWTFNSMTPIPIDGSIKLTFASDLNFAPTDTSECFIKALLLANDREHTCTMTSGLNFIKFQLAASSLGVSAFPAGQYYLYQYGVDKDNVDGIEISFTFETFTNGGVLISKSSIEGGTLQFNNNVSPPQLKLFNIVFNSLTKKFRDTIKLNFQLMNKQILFNERIVIDFGSFSLAENSNNIMCRIHESNDMSFDWFEYTRGDLRAMKLKSKKDITVTNKIYTLICNFVTTPETNSIGMQVLLTYNGLTKASSLISSLPEFKDAFNGTLPNQNISFVKSYNTFGTMMEISINFTLGIDVELNSSLIVSLPIHYNSIGFIFCFLDNNPIFCYYPRAHIILIQGFQLRLLAQVLFEIRITGILQGKIGSGTQQNFHIGFNLTNNEKILTFFNIINDLECIDTGLNHFNIYNNEINNFFTMSTNNLIFYFDSLPEDINENNFIVFDILDYQNYGNLIQKESDLVSVSIISLLDDTNKAGNIIISGLRILISLTDKLLKDQQYKLIISNIMNPEHEDCLLENYVIGITDSKKEKLTYKSVPATSNIVSLTFYKNPNLIYSQWKNSLKQNILHTKNVIEINIGTYSDIIYLVPDQKNIGFSKPLAFILNPLYRFLSILNVTYNLDIFIGDIIFPFRIGCPNTLVPQIIDIKIDKSEKNKIEYANFEYLSLSFIKNAILIEPNSYLFRICDLCKSLPIIFDVSNYRPFTNIIINFIISYPGFSLNYTFEDTGTNITKYTLTPTNTQIRLRIVSNANITLGTSDIYAILIYNIDGKEKETYKTSTNIIKISHQIAPIGIPIMKLDFKLLSNYITKETITVSCTQICLVYCSVVMYFKESPKRDFNHTQFMVKNGYQYNSMDRYQEQFYGFNVENPNTLYSFEFTNLK